MRENSPACARGTLTHFAAGHPTGARDHQSSHLREREVLAVARDRCVRSVLWRKKRIVNWPLDSNQWIIPHNTSVVRCFVGNRALVDHIGHLRQHTESMGEALRYPE